MNAQISLTAAVDALFAQNKFHPAILDVTGFGFLTHNGAGIAIAFGGDPLAMNALFDQIIRYFGGAFLRKLHIFGRVAVNVGMSFNADFDGRMPQQVPGEVIQRRP